MTPEEMLEITGQANYQNTPRLVLNEILINGDADIEEVDGKIIHKGGYFRKRIWKDKPENDKPEDINLGANVDVVLLKVRRKLVQRSTEGKIVKSTGEHNTADDVVSVYENDQKVFTGTAREARIIHDGLRTVQVVYALLLDKTNEPELVRLTVKGASLGSEARPKELPDFYQYISSFGSEAMATYVTKLGVYLEKGKKKYYTITFTRGDGVGSLIEKVIENLRTVKEYTADKKQVEAPKVAEAAIEYPEEDINPEDIPF